MTWDTKHFGRTIAAAVLGAAMASGAAHAASVAGTPSGATPFRLPDFSSYDCASLDPSAVTASRHMGQFIKGIYHEWDAIYVTSNGAKRLACISQIKPDARQLSRDEASQFLSDSFNIGAPAAAASASAAPGAAPSVLNAKPMPLRRVPANAVPGKANDLPPRAASSSSAASSNGAVPANTTAAALDSALQPATDSGSDPRIPIDNSQIFPWNTIGFLFVNMGSSQYRCSGTLVSPYVVLTAGHCLNNQGTAATYVRFYPGQSQAKLGDGMPVEPFGYNTTATLQITQTWAQISAASAGQTSYPVDDFKHDFAAAQFLSPFTFTTTFMPIIYSSTESLVENVGYPAMVQNTTAYGQYGEAGSETGSIDDLHANHIREFALDASGGDSGSPYFFTDPETGQPSLVGSLSFAAEDGSYSGGPWYDSWNQPLITSWVNWTPNAPYNAGAPNGHIIGTRIAGVASASSAAQSYLRFYNADTKATTVTVSLADPDSGFVLGTWVSPPVPAGAEWQFNVGDMESVIPPSFRRPSSYVVSAVSNANNVGTVQYVVWQPALNRLVNLGICDANGTQAGKLSGVHSGLLQGSFPSTVMVLNTATVSAEIPLEVHDARDGSLLGIYTTASIMPNGQLALPVSTLEKTIGIVPTGTMYHYVIKTSASNVMLQNLVTNTADGALEDMTGGCNFTWSY